MALSLTSVLPLARPRHLAETKFNYGELEHLKQRGARILEQLVTPQGIYASTASAWQGSYHAYFGRDTAITAALIWETEQIDNKYWFTPTTIAALFSLAKFQGRRDHQITGEELGKIPHEMRTNAEDINQLQTRWANKQEKAWHVNPFDHYLKNWDSADSTPLWIIMIGRWQEKSAQELSKDQLGHLRLGLQWCLHNLHDFRGLSGFRGASLSTQRRYGGLHNQSWKDSNSAYLDDRNHTAIHPIYDVYVNGAVWAALCYGADIFAKLDPRFAKRLTRAARALRKRFNSTSRGFRFKDKSTGLWYYAEAIDGNHRKLTAVATDPGLLLWTYHKGRSIIYRQFLRDVVKRLMKPDLLNHEAGLRTYSHNLINYHRDDTYHRGPNTYWPYESALIVSGLEYFGFHRQARRLAEASLKGVGHFNSCIELFEEDRPHHFRIWRSTSSPQTSTNDQAWTAAALYYVSTYLQKTT